MSLSREEVQHIAALCRIALSQEELDRMREQLSHILEQFRLLQQVDTERVVPTSNSVGLESVMREDKAAPSLDRSLVLSNAPQSEEDLFRVKVVLVE